MASSSLTREFAFSLDVSSQEIACTNRKDNPGDALCGIRYHPCQTCWPQAHCTVSVGTFFVSCCLQTGQGLVITYVITLFSLWARPPVQEPVHVACRKSCLFADRAAQDSSVPDEAAPRLRKQGRVRLRHHQCHYSVIELRNKSGAIVRPFCRIRCEHDTWTCHAYLFCFQGSATASWRDTAVAVAQIFPVASRKFRSLGSSNRLPNTKHRLQSDGRTRALGGRVRLGGSHAGPSH
jgi:hypothetical protein